MMRAISLLAVGLLVFVSVSSAEAQRRGRNGPTQEQRDTARDAYARGQELFQAGQFDEAEASFMDAYEAIPNPVVLLGVAEVRERRGNLPGAIEILERYLAEREDAPDRDSINERIEEMRSTPATLTVNSDPAGAEIRIDGEDTGEVTPAEIEVEPGEHTVEIGFATGEAETETVDVTFGETREVDVTLEMPVVEHDVLGEDGDGVEEDIVVEAEDEEEPGVSAGVWITAGLSGAALVAGTVLGFLALSKQSEFDDMPSDELADDGERLALFADVSFGVAAAAGITAIVLFLTDDDAGDSEDDEAASLQVSPYAGPGGAGLDARMSF